MPEEPTRERDAALPDEEEAAAAKTKNGLKVLFRSENGVMMVLKDTPGGFKSSPLGLNFDAQRTSTLLRSGNEDIMVCPNMESAEVFLKRATRCRTGD